MAYCLEGNWILTKNHTHKVHNINNKKKQQNQSLSFKSQSPTMSLSNPGRNSKLGKSAIAPGGRSGKALKGPDLRIFVKDVSDRQGKKRPLTVKTWSTVKDVKDVLQQHLGVPPSSQRLYFGPLMTSGGELPNHRTLHDAGIYRSGETLLLDVKNRHGGAGGASSACTSGASTLASISSLNALGANDICVSSSFLDVTPRGLRRTVCQARRGFAVGLKPDLVLDGSGGTYFLHDSRKAKVAVFKPADEEPYAANNPRGYVAQGGVADSGYGFGLNGGLDDGMRAGISPGEACIREVAAYLLDHGGFSGVPATTLAEARHPAFNSNGARLKLSEGGAAIGSHSLTLSSPLTPGAGSGVHVSTSHHSVVPEKKVGSFQDFVYADYTMDDLSPSKLSVDEVHKIAILDIRIMNADRNSANLLCRRRPEDPDNFELIPIDHGYCLRTVCDVCWFDWCWLDWPQLKKPLSKKSRDYILGLNIEADVRMLRERLHLKGEAIDYFRASSRLLQAGVKAGLTLYDIAIMCCRNDDAGDVASKMEALTSMATELSTSAIANGRWHHSDAAATLAEQLSASKEVPVGDKPSPKSLQLMFKSASSANFSSFISDKNENTSPRLTSKSNDVREREETEPPPGVVQSSGSDSSSDMGDATLEHEDEECEEWAAAVIADVSVDQGTSLLRFKLRSGSIGSESDSSAGSTNDSSSSNMLSTSPVGFWYVRPGSQEQDDDDRSATWSPHLSPRPSAVNLSSLALPNGVSPENLIPPLAELAERRKSTVTFDMSPLRLSSKSPLADVPPLPLNEMSEEGGKGSPTSTTKKGIGGLLASAPKNAGLVRSQSYSAFSSRSSANSSTFARTLEKTTSLVDDDEEQQHIYYLKFVNLLIERTISAIVRQRKPNKTDKASTNDDSGSDFESPNTPLTNGSKQSIPIST